VVTVVSVGLLVRREQVLVTIRAQEGMRANVAHRASLARRTGLALAIVSACIDLGRSSATGAFGEVFGVLEGHMWVWVEC
jgi:hypothetical protein